jgi:TatD DNase family protein
MIDTHCHLNFHSFENDYDKVISDAIEAGVHTIINAGTQVSSSKWAVDLAEKYKNLYAVVAVHPHHADKVTPDWLEQLEALAWHPKVIGIGECGLDYYSYQSNGTVDPGIQKEIFLKQLQLARSLGLPLQIHSRDEEARKDVIEILQRNKRLLLDIPGMFHCMAGSKESLKEILDLGFYVGFDGNSTYGGIPPGEVVDLVELIKYAPLDRIVVETDSPYLPPLPHRGERNEPKYAIITGHFIAETKKILFESLVEQTEKNVYTIFSKLKKTHSIKPKTELTLIVL